MKKYTLTLFVLIVCTLLLSACGNNPPDSATKNLALNYIAGFGGEGKLVTPEMVEVISSYEKEGRQVMVIKAGGMTCDMPVIKSSKGWGATGISCNGEIFSAQERQAAQERYDAAQREKAREQVRINLNAEIAEFVKNKPTTPGENGVLLTDVRLVNDAVAYEFTRTDVASKQALIDAGEEDLAEQTKEIAQAAVQGVCTDNGMRATMDFGFAFRYILVAANKDVLTDTTITKQDCFDRVKVSSAQ